MMVIWLGLIIVGIVLVVKWLNGQKSQTQDEESPLEILKRRYANGEIGKTEYEEKRKDLV